MAKHNVTFTIDATEFHVMLGKREGTPKPVTIDISKLPANALAAIFLYGMQRKFNDKVGGSDKTIDDKVAEVEAMRDRFYAGEVSAPRSAGASRPAWWKWAKARLLKSVKEDAKQKAKYDALADAKAKDEAIWNAFEKLPEETSKALQAWAEKQHAAELAAAAKANELDVEIKL